MNKRVFDEYPQIISASVVESAANTYTQREIPLPVVQSIAEGKALVVELLKIWVELDEADNSAGATCNVELVLVKKSLTAMVNFDDVNVIMKMRKRTTNSTAVGFEKTTIGNEVYDFQSGDGKGYLIGTKSMFLGIKGTSNAGVKGGQIKVLYRLRYVSSSELIGIIQE